MPTRWTNPSTWRRIRLIGARGGAAREAARCRGSAARGRRDLGRRGQGGSTWGGAAREAARPGGVVAVRAGWRRTGIRAAEGLGAKELGPGLLIPCKEIARGGNTTHPLWGGDLLYI